MWDEILNLALKNGLWAVLFLGLFIFVIKDSAQREKKYQKTIEDLTKHLGIVNEIKQEVKDIKEFVFKKKTSAKKLQNNKNENQTTINQSTN